MTNEQITAATESNRVIASTAEGLALVVALNNVNSELSEAQHRHSSTHGEIVTIAAKRRAVVASMLALGWVF
jgi:hypothetical protein